MSVASGRRGTTVSRSVVCTAVLALLGSMCTVAVAPSRAAASQAECLEWDRDGRCLRWTDGNIYSSDSDNFPIPEERLPDDMFALYAITSSCDGGGPPGHNTTYTCDLFTSCADPEQGRYQIWKQLMRDNGDKWRPTGDFAYVGTYCLGPDEGGSHADHPADTRWLTYLARLPAGQSTIQPPGLVTLTGLETNFFTERTEPIEYDAYFTISGWVSYRATPQAYYWDFGDGDGYQRFESAGARYPDGDVLHRYTETGTFAVEMRTEFANEIDSGDGWTASPAPNFLSRPGDPVELEVRELVNRLVSPPG